MRTGGHFCLNGALRRVNGGRSTLCCCLSKRFRFLGRHADGGVLRFCVGTLSTDPLGDHIRTSSTCYVTHCCCSVSRGSLCRGCVMRTTVSSRVYPLGRGLTLRRLSACLCGGSTSCTGETSGCVCYSVRSTRFCGGHLHVIRVSHVLPLVARAGRRTRMHGGHVMATSLIVMDVLSLKFLTVTFFTFGVGGHLTGDHERVGDRGALLSRLGRGLVGAGGQERACVRLFLSVDTMCVGGLSSCHGLMDHGVGTGRATSLLATVDDCGLTRRRTTGFCVHFSGTFVSLCPGFIRRFGRLLLPRGRVILPTPGDLAGRLHVCTLVQLKVASNRRLTALLFCSARAVCGCGATVEGQTGSLAAFSTTVGQLYGIVNWPRRIPNGPRDMLVNGLRTSEFSGLCVLLHVGRRSDFLVRFRGLGRVAIATHRGRGLSIEHSNRVTEVNDYKLRTCLYRRPQFLVCNGCQSTLVNWPVKDVRGTAIEERVGVNASGHANLQDLCTLRLLRYALIVSRCNCHTVRFTCRMDRVTF